MNSKRWYRSKTLWFNVIVLMLSMAEDQLKVLASVLPGGFYAWLSFVLPVGNVALRFISKANLTFTDPKDQP